MKETTLVNDPIFSKYAVQEYVQTPEKKHGNFGTKGGEVVKLSLCETNHDLDDCDLFLQLGLQERSRWLFHNKLCYGCFSAIFAIHNARN